MGCVRGTRCLHANGRVQRHANACAATQHAQRLAGACDAPASSLWLPLPPTAAACVVRRRCSVRLLRGVRSRTAAEAACVTRGMQLLYELESIITIRAATRLY